MRIVKTDVITKTVKELCIIANTELRKDILHALKKVRGIEKNLRARRMLDILIYNAKIAKKKRMPICQDTGMVSVYLSMGNNVTVNGDIKKSIEKGVYEAYRDGYFRKSVVIDPLIRKNTNTNLPPILYYNIREGSKIDIRVSIKGFGCENVSVTKMFKPTVPAGDIENFIIDAVKESGSRSCPPLYIGIGIGGTLDKAVLLSREAVFRRVGTYNKMPHIARLEKSILKKVNTLNIGPVGVRRGITAFWVSILTYPTHIAGLPVAVYISCHATRDVRKII